MVRVDCRHNRPISARSSARSRLAFGRSPRIICRTVLTRNQGQSLRAARIDVNGRLWSRGKAISNEKKNDALRSLRASPPSKLAGYFRQAGSYAVSDNGCETAISETDPFAAACGPDHFQLNPRFRP